MAQFVGLALFSGLGPLLIAQFVKRVIPSKTNVEELRNRVLFANSHHPLMDTYCAPAPPFPKHLSQNLLTQTKASIYLSSLVGTHPIRKIFFLFLLGFKKPIKRGGTENPTLWALVTCAQPPCSFADVDLSSKADLLTANGNRTALVRLWISLCFPQEPLNPPHGLPPSHYP